MAILEQEQRDQLKDLFKGLEQEVRVTLFSQEFECEYCKITRELLEEVSGLSDKISLTVKDLVDDKEEARSYGVDKIPAIIIAGDKDYGIRFFGVPAGYEFTPLIEDIIQVSMRQSELDQEVMEWLAKVDRPVHLQVMTSPTCPYCPMAVRTAHRLAMASDNISADMVETTEFPYLVQKYDVQGVPHTVINDFYAFVGPLSELETTYEILRALGKDAPQVRVHEAQEQVTGGVPEHVHEHEHQHQHEKKGKAKKSAKKKSKKKPKK